MHPNPQFSKVPSFPTQSGEDVGSSLAQYCGNGTGRGSQVDDRRCRLADSYALGQRPGHVPADGRVQTGLLLHPVVPPGDLRVTGKDSGKGSDGVWFHGSLTLDFGALRGWRVHD